MSVCANCYKNKYTNDKIKFFSFSWDCKKGHDCIFGKHFDHRLCQLYVSFFNEKLSFEKITQVTRKIEKAYLTLKEKIVKNQENYFFPKNKNTFVQILLKMNRELFECAQIETLIGFRQNDDMEVDDDNHQLIVSTFKNIESDLHGLFDDIFPPMVKLDQLNRHTFCRKSALFLEHFFRIHPFSDGNGRIGRLFLMLMTTQTDGFEFDFSTHKIDKIDFTYLNALRHAHKFYNSENLRRKGAAYNELIYWLEDKLKELPSVGIEDEK